MQILAAIGVVIGALGTFLAGWATLASSRATRKADGSRVRVDHLQLTLNSMQTHINTLGNENDDLRKRVTQQDEQLRRCQNDKFEQERTIGSLRAEVASLTERLSGESSS